MGLSRTRNEQAGPGAKGPPHTSPGHRPGVKPQCKSRAESPIHLSGAGGRVNSMRGAPERSVVMGRAFSPSGFGGSGSRGAAPGWYGSGRWPEKDPACNSAA